MKRTTKLQWKLDTIKNCKYLQCGLVTIAIGFAVDIEYIDKISANSLNPPPRALSWGPEGRRLVNTCDQWPINASSIDVV